MKSAAVSRCKKTPMAPALILKLKKIPSDSEGRWVRVRVRVRV